MQTAKLFENGRSQAVRLPKEFRFEGSEVYIKRLNGLVVLIPVGKHWKSFTESLDEFSEDFLSERGQPDMQSREGLA